MANERRNRQDFSGGIAGPSSERRQSEGVRIIGADEARERLDSGEAAGRRPDSERRYGDVPPPPSGPRPATRFPLPTSMDPTELPRPRIAARPAPTGPVSMPHWADPPTGEVPHIPSAQRRGSPDPDPWVASSGGGARWKGETEDWSDSDDDDFLDFGDDEGTPLGVLDPTRSEESDLYSFEEDFERLEEERAARNYEGSRRAPYDDPEDDYAEVYEEERRESRPLRARTSAPPAPRRGPPNGGYGEGGGGGGGRNLVTATVVGLVLLLLLVVADAVGSRALVVLAAAVLLVSAIEAYGVLQKAGFRPATLLGLVATVGVTFAAYWKGTGAIPLVTAVMFGASMAWYLLRIVDARPLANVAVTTMTYVWIGLMGSFAAVMLRAQHGSGLFLGAVLTAVAADVVAYLAGSRFGSHQLAPQTSPGKTVEGVIAGGLASIVVGLIVGKEITPWGGLAHGFALGVLVAIVAPIGDLFESMVKRDLGIKDSGGILPGHGGALDRFDSLLLVLPAVYYLALTFNIVK